MGLECINQKEKADERDHGSDDPPGDVKTYGHQEAGEDDDRGGHRTADPLDQIHVFDHPPNDGRYGGKEIEPIRGERRIGNFIPGRLFPVEDRSENRPQDGGGGGARALVVVPEERPIDQPPVGPCQEEGAHGYVGDEDENFVQPGEAIPDGSLAALVNQDAKGRRGEDVGALENLGNGRSEE